MPGLIATANRVNDFVVKFANVNGTGSASANSLVMKAIFRMGVPVTGKNYFPSNIQGLPTWYEIRVTRDGYAARASQVDIMVAMNAETYSRDVRELASGGYLIYDSTWPRSSLLEQRGDITVIEVPLAKLVNENFDGVRNRILLKNIAYAGVLAALIDVDLGIISALLSESYGKKPKLLDSNTKALRLGYDFVKQNLTSPLPLRVAHMDKTRGHIMIDGNTAAGLGCVYAGATVDLADGCVQGVLRTLPHRSHDRRAKLCHSASRGRTGRRRHRARRIVERCARLHADQRTGHLPDERIHRFGLLRRSAGRDLRRTAGGALDRHADANAAVGHHDLRLRVARRYAACTAVSGKSRRMLLHGGAGFRSR
jgi:Pyruvate/2-oxoacid:ferredoxin oxidoreductase gamma subunit